MPMPNLKGVLKAFTKENELWCPSLQMELTRTGKLC